jgi:hypothetical protein
MSAPTKPYLPFAVGLAATVGAVAGIVIASFRFKLPKPPQGG